MHVRLRYENISEISQQSAISRLPLLARFLIIVYIMCLTELVNVACAFR